jgi:hypothetical protein
MFEFHAQIMICNSQHRQPLIRNVLLILLVLSLDPLEGDPQKLILQQYNGQHGMLLGILVLIELAKHRTQVQMGICECGRLLHSKLKLQCLDQVRKGSPQLAGASVVTCEVVVCCGFVL